MSNKFGLRGIVTIGVPVQRMSMPVVCPLHSGVSKQTSASWPRRACSSENFKKFIRLKAKILLNLLPQHLKRQCASC